MKKLMIAAVAVAMAACGQAATAAWNSGAIGIAGDKDGTYTSTAAGKGVVTAYLFTLTAGEFTSASELTTSQLYEKYVTSGTYTPAHSTTSGLTGQANLKDKTIPDASSESPKTYYGLVIYEDKTTAGNYDGVDAFVKAILDSKVYQDTTGPTFTSVAGTSNWTAISSVPEPTSGLLLLLGVAGLALRRRRA